MYIHATLSGRSIDEPTPGIKWVIRREYANRKWFRYLSKDGKANHFKFARIFDTEGDAADMLIAMSSPRDGSLPWRVVPIKG